LVENIGEFDMHSEETDAGIRDAGRGVLAGGVLNVDSAKLLWATRPRVPLTVSPMTKDYFPHDAQIASHSDT
jgi:hypothetical protein